MLVKLFSLWLPLTGVVATWVDPDTLLADHRTRSLVDGQTFDLVFSDEFNVVGRTFDDGHDPRWTAIHKNDYTNTALQFYDKEKVSTSIGGYLNITTIVEKTIFMTKDDTTLKYHPSVKNFSSGMVQSWNKFCFTGGVVEVRAKLPGSAYIGGLWPAIWLLGNLARATYVGSSDWIWPWSFDTCNRDLQPKQLISACSPGAHYGMNSFSGRGAPEIDILEAMPGNAKLPPSPVSKPYFSTSLQIAPGVPDHRPGNGGPPGPGSWYEGLEYGENSSQNIFFYGTMNTKQNDKYSYQSDAISGNTQLVKSQWEKEFHTYRVEWALPQSSGSSFSAEQGYIRWFMDDKLIYGITGHSLDSMVKGSMIPSEPQYILLNTAMSSSWGFPQPCPEHCDCSCFDCSQTHFGQCGCGIAPGFCDTLPAHFLIDFVRVFQLKSDPNQKVGCSTPERPTKKWIEGHVDAYKDEWDETPLKNIQRGGADCSGEPTSCGSFGQCTSGHVCACDATHTGPRCLAHAGSDPIEWDADPGLGFYRPDFSPYTFLVIMVTIAIALTWAKVRKDQNRKVSVLEESTRISYQMQRELQLTKPLQEGGVMGNTLSYKMRKVTSATEELRDIPMTE